MAMYETSSLWKFPNDANLFETCKISQFVSQSGVGFFFKMISENAIIDNNEFPNGP
jgi:hypothetical protein